MQDRLRHLVDDVAARTRIHQAGNADALAACHQKIRQRNGPCLPSLDASNNVYSLLASEDGDDSLSVNKANYNPYTGSVVMNMALKVECCDAAGMTMVTFMSSRHSTTSSRD